MAAWSAGVPVTDVYFVSPATMVWIVVCLMCFGVSKSGLLTVRLMIDWFLDLSLWICVVAIMFVDFLIWVTRDVGWYLDMVFFKESEGFGQFRDFSEFM